VRQSALDRPVVLEGPVRVEFGMRAELRDGPIGHLPALPHTARVGYLRVRAARTYEAPADCAGPERAIVGDPRGHRVAYRCRTSERWRPLWIGERNALRYCWIDVGSGEVDWSQLPDLSRSVEQFARCSDPLQATALFSELEASGGAALLDGLVRTAALSLELGDLEDAWLSAAARLDAASRTRLMAHMRSALAQPAEAPTVLRALLLLGTIDEEPAAMHARSIAPRAARGEYEANAASILLRRLAPARAALAGELACRAFSSIAQVRDPGGPAIDRAELHALIVIAGTGSPCDAIAREIVTGDACARMRAWEWAPGPPRASEATRELVTSELAGDPVARVREMRIEAFQERPGSRASLLIAAALSGPRVPPIVASAAARCAPPR
jgi:hypothetical protein